MKRTTADKWFSEFIRMRYADYRGYVECFTCGKIGFWRHFDCGHYVKRQFQSLRFNEINCQVQCKYCNHYLQGNDAKFRANLINLYGEQKILHLECTKKTITKLTEYKLQAITDYYKEQVKELKKEVPYTEFKKL